MMIVTSTTARRPVVINAVRGRVFRDFLIVPFPG
jgi:hypothetical protein